MSYVIMNRMKQGQPILVKDATGRGKTKILAPKSKPGSQITISDAEFNPDIQRRADKKLLKIKHVSE